MPNRDRVMDVIGVLGVSGVNGAVQESAIPEPSQANASDGGTALQPLVNDNVVGVTSVAGTNEPSGATHHATTAESQADASDGGAAAQPLANDNSTSPIACSSTGPVSEFPRPPALESTTEFVWKEEDAFAENAKALGRRLAASDLYRAPAYAGGLILGSPYPNVPPLEIKDARSLAPVILDRLRIRYFRGGKQKGCTIPPGHLNNLLRTEVFLQQFKVVDEVIDSPRYFGSDYALTMPGYQDGGVGQRFFFAGEAPWISDSLVTINAFLDVMPFASPADRTNAVGAALLRLLRNYWPGGKPLVPVTGTKSHSGKETIIDFITGNAARVSISYQANADWPLERSFVGALKRHPDLAVINVENARLGRPGGVIASSYIERFATDPLPFLFSTGTGQSIRRTNSIVVTLSSNYGSFSEDILNRSMPIHLAPIGNLAARSSPIGNPKHEFLPANRARIDAEFRGMFQRWNAAGRPLDVDVRHPFIECVRVIGGILKVSGFPAFLGNYAARRTVQDPVRHALGLLGVHASLAKKDWLRSAEWAQIVVECDLESVLIASACRGSLENQQRAIGEVFSKHEGETFLVTTEDAKFELLLEKARKRWERGAEPATKYRFVLLGTAALPFEEFEDTGAANHA